jgi:hypothetical protein
MSYENRPKAPTTQKERDAMAIRILENPDYIDDELGQNLLKLIRKGLVYVYANGMIEITEEGEQAVALGHDTTDEVYNA